VQILKALIAALPAIAALACTTPPPEGQTQQVDGFVQIVEPVARGVHVMRQAEVNFAGVVGNVTIIEQDDNIVLVDTGSSYGDGGRVVREVRRLSNKPVSAVIITHWHNDHPLGLPAIIEAWPNIEIISTEFTRDSLANGLTTVPIGARDTAWEARRVEQLQGYVAQMQESVNTATTDAERAGYERARTAQPIRASDAPGTYVVLPTRTFADRLTLDDRTTPIEISFLGRANTDGDAIIWLPRQRVLIAGDAVVWPIPYNFAIHPAENIATLERLRAFNYAALIPGHGEVQRNKDYLDLLIAFSRDVQTQVAPLAQSGTVEEVTAQLPMEDYAQRFAGDDPWMRYWFNRYAREPLIASAYEEVRPAAQP
jgi:glyoxylase-like metal-dependent hydrolase (beta-lactamase superfamily II)